MRAYDDAGASVTSKEITLDANAAQTIEAGNLSGDHGTAVVLMLEDSSKKVSWGARFSHDSLQDKDIAGLSVIDASTLMPATVHVWLGTIPPSSSRRVCSPKRQFDDVSAAI